MDSVPCARKSRSGDSSTSHVKMPFGIFAAFSKPGSPLRFARFFWIFFYLIRGLTTLWTPSPALASLAPGTHPRATSKCLLAFCRVLETRQSLALCAFLLDLFLSDKRSDDLMDSVPCARKSRSGDSSTSHVKMPFGILPRSRNPAVPCALRVSSQSG